MVANDRESGVDAEQNLVCSVVRGRLVEQLVSDDLTRLSSEKPLYFRNLSVNFCTRSSVERTDHSVDIDLYYAN